MNTIDNFRGKYFFLSNFSNYPVIIDNIKYRNAEAAFQAQKTKDEKIKKSFAPLFPNEAKHKGRHIKLRDDWEEVKDDLMYKIVFSKFNNNNHLKELLLKTNDAYLEEGNNWHDNYWGNCKCSRCKNKIGENKLGKILMKVRTNLKAIEEENIKKLTID